MSSARILAVVVVCLFSALSACSDPSPESGSTDTGLSDGSENDTGADTGFDSAPDAPEDAVEDITDDTDNDTGDDTTDDADNDAVEDTTDDTDNDAAEDTSDDADNDIVDDTTDDTTDDADNDTGDDITDDADNDAVEDTTDDTDNDTGEDTDVAVDTGTDTPTDVISDTGTDTNTDVAVDTWDPGPINFDSFLSPPYLMWVTRDAVTVRWESEDDVLGFVEYGTTPALGMRADGNGTTKRHEIRLTGLDAGSIYYYRVGWGEEVSDTWNFLTAPEDDFAGPIQFNVWGDNQDGDGVFSSVMDRMSADQPDFIIGAGDMVQSGSRDNYREQLFGPMFGVGNYSPFLASTGNHEYYANNFSLSNSQEAFDMWREYYSQPLEENCFGWRYGELFFLFVDTQIDFGVGSDQWDCLSDQFASPQFLSSSFQIAIFHHPPRIEWWNGGAIAFTDGLERPAVRTFLEGQLESQGFDLVFNGHNHLYAHTPTTSGGITWVTTGGGGGGLESEGFLSFNRVGTWDQIETQILGEHHYMRVVYEDGTATLEAVQRSGEVMHSFSVTPVP